MKCPTCTREMSVDRTDINKVSTNKSYDRVVYDCKYDDNWVTTEIPVKEEEVQ